MRIKNRIIRLCMGVGIFSALLCGQSAAANIDVEFHEAASDVMMSSLQTQPENSFLRKLYTQLFFVPVWINEDSVSSFAQELFVHIKEDKTLHSHSKLYQDAVRLEQKAQDVYSSNSSISQKVDLEFKISQLYKGYADYTLYGSINWGAFQDRLYNLKAQNINADWVTYKPSVSTTSLLEYAALNGSLKEAFKHATPKEYNYAKLRQSLIAYLDIQNNGGWAPVPLKGSLKEGNSYDVVPLLRERLRITGDYKECSSSETSVYDACLKKAVIHFQKRNGLASKGEIGKNTITALNMPVEKRIEKIRLNLDRIKWLNERNEKRHIMINIPAFTFYFEEDKALLKEMKVITGKSKNPTPIFSNRVQTIVLNPDWNVPNSIIQKEMIPQLLKNPNAMARQGIEIRTGWEADAEKVSGGSVDWNQYRYSKNVPFRFAQVPGERNALGKVKFLFPNQFSVYMHDTPGKNLFDRDVRAFSHGCIRLAEPRELLKIFSTFNETVDFDKAEEKLKGKENEFLPLRTQVPIDVIYLTAFVDHDGILQFRDDIYGYDKMQLQSYRKW